ncbi:CLUMA_CG011174, isoform A [Clunio marinus]|uniref:CLUMA_CG011174, isoform A n=1 Tax=Clunio marinus TaxID=568069 RepID=A0A1J1IC66_9DIPT|nr:CLUMA_CG011174, isoform A [Clunio marinus]
MNSFKNHFLYFILILLEISFVISNHIGCRDEKNNLIDWFYLYKLPNSIELDNNIESLNTGKKYLFITPSSSQWIASNNSINDEFSMPGLTLSNIYDGKSRKNNIVMIYNDEPSNGHTKGVVVANDISGFWMVHSVPKYPPAMEENSYSFPKSGEIYGQSFLCISLDGNQIDKVGKQLKYNEAHFYSSHVPEHLKTIYPSLVDALKMETIDVPPFYNIEMLESIGGTMFTSFAKSRKFKKELYEDWVAPHFGAGNYFVETWRHGPGNIKSDCMKLSKVYNIETILFDSTSKIEFKTLHDHSKWMVCIQHDLLCVGDINRQEHQKLRGGGTVCQQHNVSTSYNNLINKFENCQN